MIIYGSKNKQLAKGIISDKCGSCGTENSTDLYVFQKYAHLFWVPLFPMGKTGVSQCDHCKKVYTLKETPPPVKTAYHHLKAQTKTPIWTYTGGAIIGIFILAAAFTESQKREHSASYIKQLAPNDILEFKTSEGHYTFLKVEDVKGDSVYLRENKEEVLFESAMDKLSSSEASFRDEVYLIPRQEIIKKFGEGTILNVLRTNSK